MLKRNIYVRENKSIRLLNIFILEQNLLEILEKINEHYDVKKERKQVLGSFIPYYLFNDKIIKIVSKEKISLNNHNLYIDPMFQPIYKFVYEEFEPTGLSKIIVKIIRSNNNDDLSYNIKELFSYTPMNDFEKKIFPEILSCLEIDTITNNLNIKKIYLSLQYKIELKDINYFDDEDSFSEKIRKIPYLKSLNK